MSENDLLSVLHVIIVGVNRCLLSVFGALLAAGTLYDVKTSLSLGRKTSHNAGLHSTTTTDDGAADHNSLINNPQPRPNGQNGSLSSV